MTKVHFIYLSRSERWLEAAEREEPPKERDPRAERRPERRLTLREGPGASAALAEAAAAAAAAAVAGRPSGGAHRDVR